MFQMTRRSGWLQVGACDIDLMRRIVTSRKDGRTSRLTIKAQQVLLVLVEARGMVVSRGALLSRVWPDTMPTDDVLTQAVTQLRKAFGDDRATPLYIETIAKGGYRLLANCEWKETGVGLREDDQPLHTMAEFAPAWEFQRCASAAADAAFVAALTTLLWAMVRRDAAERPSEEGGAPEEMMPVVCGGVPFPLV